MQRSQLSAVLFAAVLTVTVMATGGALAADPSPSIESGPTLADTSDTNITSEGTELIGGQQLRDANQTGDTVTVAVIDAGFSGSPAEDTSTHDPIVDNVIEYNDISGESQSEGDKDHGDGSAELVADVAPNVELVLYTTSGTNDWTTIANDIEDRNNDANRKDIDIVSMSIGSTNAPLDGSITASQAIDDAVDSGTIWVTSAGNEAGGNHYSADYQTGEYTRQHEFGGDETRDNLTAIGPDLPFNTYGFGGTLHWNGESAQDYEFEVVLYEENENGVYEAEETISTQDPDTARAPFNTNLNSDENHAIGINRIDGQSVAPTDLQFNIFVDTGAEFTEHPTAESSLTVPATAPSTYTVGAATASTSRENKEITATSSRGPALDGGPGVDIVGPTDVSTEAYGGNTFGGTSGAAPHVAGTAAVVMEGFKKSDQAGTDPTTAAVQERIKLRAFEMAGTESEIGAGHLDAAAATIPQTPASANGPDTVSSQSNDAVPVNVALNAEPVDGTITVEAFDEHGTIATESIQVEEGTQEYTTNLDVTTADDGTVSLTAHIEDDSGLQSLDAGTLDQFELDTEKPNADVVASPDTVNENTEAVDVEIDFTKAMDTSESPTIQVEMGGETTIPNETGEWTSDTRYVTQIDAPQSEERQSATVSVTEASDNVGNPIGESTGGTFVIDTTPPAVENFNAEKGLNESNVTLTTDKELEGATIQVDGPDAGTLTLGDSLTLESTSNGLYQYTGTYETTSPGDYTLTVTTLEDSAGNDGANSQSTETTITDEDVGVITGTITDSSTGDSLSNVTVTATDLETETTQEIAVDDAGTFSATVATGDYTLDATHNESNYHPNSATITSELLTTTQEDIQMDPKPASISGLVEIEHENTVSVGFGGGNDGELEGTEVTVSDSETTTTATIDNNNEFSIEEIEPGEYTVTIDPEDYTAFETVINTTPNGSTTVDATVNPLPATISGTVTDNETDNAPIFAIVDAVNTEDNSVGNFSEVDEDTGEYSLEVSPGDYTVIATGPFYEDVDLTESLEANGSASADFTLNRVDSYMAIESGVIPAEGTTGDTVELEATVTNRGNNTTTGNVTFNADSEQVATETTSSLETDQTETVTVQYTLPDTDENTEIPIEVETDNETVPLGSISVLADDDDDDDNGGGGGGGGGAGGGGAAPVEPEPDPAPLEFTKPENVSVISQTTLNIEPGDNESVATPSSLTASPVINQATFDDRYVFTPRSRQPAQREPVR